MSPSSRRETRCGGRIWSLPAEEFGYPAEGGAEFVHGAAPVTRGLLRAAHLSLAPMGGTRWSARNGPLAPDEAPAPHAGRLHQALAALKTDLPIAEFLETRFAGPQYQELRRSITRMVEGYDAADPSRASTFALRDEWMDRGLDQQGRVAQGYGALIEFLARGMPPPRRRDPARRRGGGDRFGRRSGHRALP